MFCGIVAGDVPNVKGAEDETTYAFMDINPASDGHLLVVPKRHSRDLFEIPDADLTAVTLAARRIAEATVEEFGADRVNLLNCCGAAAWQTVFHFYLHVVPRYVDKTKDRLVLPWRPGTPGDPDTLAALGGRLSATLERFDGRPAASATEPRRRAFPDRRLPEPRMRRPEAPDRPGRRRP